MRWPTRLFIGLVVTAAIVSLSLLYLADPVTERHAVEQIAILAVLALIAEALSYMLSKAVTGSAALIPYVAMVLVSASWLAPAAALLLKALYEFKTRTFEKALFNVAQIVVAVSTAVAVYRFLGGVPLETLADLGLLGATNQAGVPALVATIASWFVNAGLVLGVVAVSSQRSLRDVWRESFGMPPAFELLIAPVAFVFAWVFVSFGAIAVLTLWVPILGLRQVHRSNQALEQTNRELLELMVKSIEARDPYTSGHSRRVHHFSVTIARAVGLGPKEADRVGRAALLHDIGKIHEKYAPLLRKVDKLSPEEWRIIKEHPIDGADLIATMSGLKDLVLAVRHHHENWDGTGYPDGLAGELIPLESRIIMLADTIDAMTSERPYRGPLTPNEVRAEFVRCRGMQFDPALTDRLLSSDTWLQLFGPDREDLDDKSIVRLHSRPAKKVAAVGD